MAELVYADRCFARRQMRREEFVALIIAIVTWGRVDQRRSLEEKWRRHSELIKELG